MKENARFFTPSFLTKIIPSCLWMWIFGFFVHDCTAVDDKKRPSEHFCPITYEVMKDPVVAADGYSYERSAIETYFKSSPSARSPMTGSQLPNKTLVVNQALRIMINDWTPNIPVTPSPLSGDADILTKRIQEEFQKNAALLDSSKGKHIVAFLGNTGAGKSTLVNFLAGKEIVVSDDEEDYVLANPQDKTAMVIGRGGHSETVYPQFIDVGNLRFFDLPGFNDTDGTERNLMSAAFIRKILLDAASVRLVFVAGEDQFTADRSASVRQLFDGIKQLFVVDQDNINLVDDGVFVATKVTCAPQTELTDFLSKKTDSKDKAALNQQLKLWSDRNQLGRMFHPLMEAQNKGVREQILEFVEKAKSAKILGINVSVLYPPDTKAPLERLFLKAFRGAFDLKLQKSPQTLSDYDGSLSRYASGGFWATFDGEVCQNEEAVRLLKEFCINSYHQALKTFEKESTGRLQKHIEGLRQKRQERVGYVEKSTEVRTREVIASLVPPQVGGDYVFFDFAYHRDYYDQVCGKGTIEQISADTEEQEVARRYYAGFISRHSHEQMMRWHEKFSGVGELVRQLCIVEMLTIPIPSIAQGYEDIYRRFVKGTLIYRPDQSSDKGRIDLPIAALANPLEGTFDLSRCGGTGKYLSISTGYRKGKKPENASKVEVWFALRFLVEKELNGTASHFKPIMGNWKQEQAPVGIFWTRGNWDNMGAYEYLTTESMESLSKIDLYENWKKTRVAGGAGVTVPRAAVVRADDFHVSFVS